MPTRGSPPNMPLQTDRQQPGLIDLGCRRAAYSGGRVGIGQRCCWPLNADPLGGRAVMPNSRHGRELI